MSGMSDRQRLNVLQAWTQARDLLSAGFTVEQTTNLIHLRERWRPDLAFETVGWDKDQLRRYEFIKFLIEKGLISDKIPEG